MTSEKSSVRLTIHVRQEILQLMTFAGCGRRDDGREGSTWSSRVSDLARRMEYLIRSHLPRFTRAEWSAIMDANRGGPLPESAPESILTATVANVARSLGLAEKWGVDVASIVAKLRLLSPVESIVMGEAQRYFWDNCHIEKDELFDRLGIPKSE